MELSGEDVYWGLLVSPLVEVGKRKKYWAGWEAEFWHSLNEDLSKSTSWDKEGLSFPRIQVETESLSTEVWMDIVCHFPSETIKDGCGFSHSLFLFYRLDVKISEMAELQNRSCLGLWVIFGVDLSETAASTTVMTVTKALLFHFKKTKQRTKNINRTSGS